MRKIFWVLVSGKLEDDEHVEDVEGIWEGPRGWGDLVLTEAFDDGTGWVKGWLERDVGDKATY